MRVYRESKTRRWYVDYFFRGQRLRFAAGRTKRAAEALISRINIEINTGTHDPDQIRREIRGIDGETLSFGDAVKQFLAEYKPRGGTIRYYRQRADVWKKFFDERPVAHITNGEVAEMLSKRQEEVSDSTARKELI